MLFFISVKLMHPTSKIEQVSFTTLNSKFFALSRIGRVPGTAGVASLRMEQFVPMEQVSGRGTSLRGIFSLRRRDEITILMRSENERGAREKREKIRKRVTPSKKDQIIPE